MTHAVASITEKPAFRAWSAYEAICSCGFAVGNSLSAWEAGYQMRLHIEFMAARSAEKKGRRKAA
jgi:hypothetical protein